MLTIELLSPGLEILNAIVTDVLDRVKSLTGGSLVLSSGRAEVKSQSSSAVAPLLRCGGPSDCDVEFPGWADGAKLKMEAEGDGWARLEGGAFVIGDGSRGGGDAKMAKGSD